VRATEYWSDVIAIERAKIEELAKTVPDDADLSESDSWLRVCAIEWFISVGQANDLTFAPLGFTAIASTPPAAFE
jgi:hypothetical protein